MNIPITQSKAWKTLQDDLNETSFFVKSDESAEKTAKNDAKSAKNPDNFQYLAILKQTPVGNYLYLPYGPVAETEKGFKKALESLETLAKEKSAIFIRIEPRAPGIAQKTLNSAKKVKDLNPKETWVLDLTGNDADLKAKLPSRLLRYYKNVAKNGLTIETTKDPEKITELLKLQTALAKEKNISTFSENYLKTELKQPFATLYLVKSEDSVLAAGLVFDDETTRYNLQGAQSEQGRKLHATGILTIQLILDAKAKNLETFDFWGIAPDGAGPDHPWYGFTSFKKTFKGSEKTYAGTHDLVLNPAKYRLYTATRKINKILRKIKS